MVFWGFSTASSKEIIEQAGDWNGDREAYPQVVRLLEKLDAEYRYNVHDRELWPAVLELIEPQAA